MGQLVTPEFYFADKGRQILLKLQSLFIGIEVPPIVLRMFYDSSNYQNVNVFFCLGILP